MRDRHLTTFAICTILAGALVAAAPAAADGGVTFQDVAGDGASGIHYERTPSPRLEPQLEMEAEGEMDLTEFFAERRPNSPMKPFGTPGVALFDYDNDGDLDIYVTNGPRNHNSLYENSFAQTGTLGFTDVAVEAGVGAWEQDSTGVCYGDIDNDGDQDLYVLGVGESNRLFENRTAQNEEGPNGGAFFFDVTDLSGTGGGDLHSSVCSFGDFNGDGLLDLVVGNTYDSWAHMLPVFGQGYIGREHNQIFLNQGGNQFVDASAVSGIQQIDHSFLAPEDFKELPTLTWGIAAVDFDLDGDTDIFWGDSGAYNRVFENDGSGFFTDRTHDFGLSDHHGSWMGFSFGDFNCDGLMDFFSTDLGNYLLRSTETGASRWFLGTGDGFVDPGLGDQVIATPFGWGNVTTDYDNDGDTDIIFHGAMDLLSVNMADNPGVVLQNQGCGEFAYDFDALTRDHGPRVVEGVAVGDLNNDGFEDIVSAAGLQIVPSEFYLPWPGILSPPLGSPMDEYAMFEGQWLGTPEGRIVWLEPTRLPGDLAVEINSGDNGNGWVKVDLLGGAGLVSGAESNRNGVGAVILFTPEGGETVMRPVTGGESYASANSLTATFGLGDAERGTVEVLWPGGTRNRLYDVEAGEQVLIPEIPCSFDGGWKNQGQYAACHQQALAGYKQAGFLTAAEKNRLRRSANRAYRAER